AAGGTVSAARSCHGFGRASSAASRSASLRVWNSFSALPSSSMSVSRSRRISPSSRSAGSKPAGSGGSTTSTGSGATNSATGAGTSSPSTGTGSGASVGSSIISRSATGVMPAGASPAGAAALNAVASSIPSGGASGESASAG